LSDVTTYRARLRFRVIKKLNIDANEHRLAVAGREIVLTPPKPERKIKESEWLIMNTRGFATEEEARQFGHKLRAALEVSSVANRLGVDAGRDLPTAGVGRTVRETARDLGVHLRDNVHGLDVFPDDPNTAIFGIEATGSVLTGADNFLAGLNELFDVADRRSQRVADVVLLLNFALMRPEPVAQIVFAVSAVEMLGQDETWSDDQKQLLRALGEAAAQSAIGTAEERREVADAITKSLHRLTLRQGVFRLLDRLGLAHLKPRWDALYAERSALVHGLAPKPGENYSDLANRTVSLCGEILLAAIAAEIPGADRHAGKMYGA
jgi:hypothetical protein